MKKILKKYYAPTPKKWRKIGDTLLAVSLYAQTQEAFMGYTKLMAGVAIVGLVGKFLSNFFAEEAANEQI
jgi:hypothetical protein